MPAKRPASTPLSRTTVRLPDDLHRRAKLAAAWMGTKIQDFIAQAVERHLTQIEMEMSGDEEPGRKRVSPPRPKSR